MVQVSLQLAGHDGWHSSSYGVVTVCGHMMVHVLAVGVVIVGVG